MWLCSRNKLNIKVVLDADNRYKEADELDNQVKIKNITIENNLNMCKGTYYILLI